MKKYISLLLVAMAILATSCNKQNVNEPEQLVAGEGQFLATIAENSVQNAPSFSGADNSTQAAFNGNNVMWQVSDEINVNGTTFTCNSQPQTNKAIFENEDAPAMTAPFTAYYPASVANGLPSSFTYDAQHNANMLPMYATSSTRTLEFNNICAALKITLPANFSASKIEISNLNNAINGAFTVTNNVAVMHTTNVTEAEKKITITGTFTGGEVIYAPMPAGTYTNFTIRMLDASDNQTWFKIIPTLTVAANKIYDVRIDADYFGFTAKAANSSVTITKGTFQLAPNVTLQYKTVINGTESGWSSDFPTNTSGTTIQLPNVGDKVYFRAGTSGNTIFCYNVNRGFANIFTGTGNLEVSGNIMYLLNQNPSTTFSFSSSSSPKSVFTNLFYGNTAITDASKLVLPAQTLTKYCYEAMFKNCTALTAAPALPATTMADNCYYAMFYGCSALTAAPALPATTMANSCYTQMFCGCSALTAAPALPATTMAEFCYSSMFEGCDALATAPALPATTMAEYCYSSMFSECSTLTTAPALPATTLADYCYSYMFSGCSNLNYIEVGFSSWDDYDESTEDWVNGVASSGTFKCPSGLSIEYDESHIPDNWTVTH